MRPTAATKLASAHSGTARALVKRWCCEKVTSGRQSGPGSCLGWDYWRLAHMAQKSYRIIEAGGRANQKWLLPANGFRIRVRSCSLQSIGCAAEGRRPRLRPPRPLRSRTQPKRLVLGFKPNFWPQRRQPESVGIRACGMITEAGGTGWMVLARPCPNFSLAVSYTLGIRP